MSYHCGRGTLCLRIGNLSPGEGEEEEEEGTGELAGHCNEMISDGIWARNDINVHIENWIEGRCCSQKVEEGDLALLRRHGSSSHPWKN